MKYLYIKYQGNKRTTTISNGSTIVHKIDRVEPIAPTATTTLAVATTTDLNIMCADKIHENYIKAHRDYLKGIR